MSPDYTGSDRAAGSVEGFDHLFHLLDKHRADYDAVAIASVISTPMHYYSDYFLSDGNMVNPWGGVESMLTHTISSLYDLPSAHAPMLESQDVLDIETGIVDPRMAAEVISVSFLQCVLKGLQRSPRIITDEKTMQEQGVLTARNISCLVQPDQCLGLPTIAALEQGIPVITIDSDAPESKRVTFIGTDNYQAGRQGGEIALKILQKVLSDRKVKQVNIIILTVPGQLNLDERVRGYRCRDGDQHPPAQPP